ncbi:4'-phosphopantetheinyl transferase family protein [Sanguibacter gelidistatuariae]|uniref:4'-phosphopantetheinyl transferase family protein n=1 Tax=Sanguibacter gelidistatuariae TaxID=1814289 RepID=UPI0011137661|nr:4'-phosphopantetheinyl transferase superfamily protein [Sanguibacter gelidistatuariae]
MSVSWGVALDGPELYAAARLLDEGERRRAAALRDDQAQRRFVSAHAMLRILVGQRLDLDPHLLAFAPRGAYGKPELVHHAFRLHVNIASAGDRVVCGVTESGPIGVDVESHSVIADANRFGELDRILLTPAERRVLGELEDRVGALTRWWVRKEAVLKASGEGLTIEPTTLQMSAPDEAPQLLGWQGRPVPALWMSDLDVGDGYEAAVVVVT